jgi:hypothetical protein
MTTSPRPVTTSPQAIPNAAPDPAPPLTWRYPFPSTRGKEVTDPNTLYHAFGRMDDGFFPLGVNGFPHGGVHFGEITSLYVDQAEGVRCLADGEIVAYKLDAQYEQLHFAQDRKWAMYSTGFVLVRHRLSLPSVHGSTAAGDDTQDLFSLYMHMADWDTYLASDVIKRPGWWIGVTAFRIGSVDQQADGGAPGANVRTEPKAGKRGGYTAGQLVGFLPQGSEVIIGEKRGGWGHIQSITAGQMISPTRGGTFGGDDDLSVPWYTSGNTAVTPQGDYGWLYLNEQHAVTEPTDVGSVVIPPQPIPVKAGTLLGQLGEYHDYERATLLPPVPKRQLLHLEVFAGDDFKTFLDKSRARAAQLPAEQNTLLAINAGTKLVSDDIPADRTLGTYGTMVSVTLTTDSPATGPWVKVRTWRKVGNTLSECDPAPLWIKRWELDYARTGTAAWSRFPLQLAQAADPANGLAFISTRAELDGQDPTTAQAVDEQGLHWWRVAFATAEGKTRHGWVCEKNHPGTQWLNPWAWPGFEIVDATDIALTDAFQRNLVVTGSATGQEQSKFKPATDTVNNTPLLRKLDGIVSQLPPPESYGRKPPTIDPSLRVNARAIMGAMQLPWLAQRLSHLILRYESEWGGNMARWESITPLMRNARENWECELQRIRKLQWWNDVKGKVEGFPDNPVVYHIHPIALVGNFISQTANSDEITYLAKTLYGESRGEPHQSKVAVAWVIRNRVESGVWGKTYKATVTAKGQFTCWSKDIDPGNYDAIQNPSGPLWEECKQVASEVINAPYSANVLPGAINYYSPRSQRALHIKYPSIYPETPPFANPAKEVPNPPGVDKDAYKFYRR